MAKKITNESFISKDFLQPAIDKVKEFISVINDVKENLKGVGVDAQKNLEGLDPSKKVKDFEKLNTELTRLASAEEKLLKLQETEQAQKAKIRQLNDQLLKQKKKEEDAQKKSNEELQKKLELARMEIKTVQDITTKNKFLVKSLETINLTTEQGRKEYKRISQEIENNNNVKKQLIEEIKRERKEREQEEKAIEAEKRTLQGLIKTQNEAIEANKALRIAVKKLDTETQGEKIRELNALIDQNSKLIEDNSDSYNQSKINVRRYTESINAALAGNEDFAKVQSALNIVMAISEKLFKKDEKAVDKNTESRENLTEANENLEKSSENVNNSLRNNAIGVILTAVTTILGLFSQTEEGAESLAVNIARIEVAIKLVFERSKAFALVVVDSFVRAGKEAELFGIKAKNALNVFSTTSLEDTKRIKTLEAEILSLDKAIDENLNRTTANFTETLKENDKTIQELVIAERKFNKELANTEKALIKLQGEEQKQRDLRDSDVASFEDRTKAGQKAIQLAEKIGQTELKLAQSRVEFANKRIEIELRQAGVVNASANQIQNITQFEQLRGKVSVTTLQAQTDAYKELLTQQNEYQSTIIENFNQQALLRRDIFERDLDDNIDYFANVQAINERIIASDTETFDNKLKAQETIRTEAERSFRRSIEIIEAEKIANLEAEINLAKRLGDTDTVLKKEKELANFKIDAERILAIENADEFNKEIRRLGLNEIFEDRSLGVFRERRTIKQDEKEINADIFQQNQDELKLNEDLLLLEKELAKIKENNAELERISTIENLEERQKATDEFNKRQEQFDTDIEREKLEKELELVKQEIDERIKLGQDGTKKVKELRVEQAKLEIELNKKKNEQIEKDNEESLAKQAAAEEEAAAKRKEFFETAVIIFENFLQKQNAKRLKNIDEQLTAIEQRQDQLRTAAENGNEEAVKSLADSEKKEAEIRIEKEKELQRQKKIEAGLAAFKLLAAKAEKDPKTALPETLKEILTLDAFVDTLPGFFSGTENIGESMGKPHLNKAEDAYLALVDGMGLARLDGGERILPTKQNKIIGNMSNNELTDLVVNSKRGVMKYADVQKQSITINSNNANMERLLSQLVQETRKTSQQIPNVSQSFDNRTGVITETYQYLNKTERNHKKLFTPIRKNK